MSASRRRGAEQPRRCLPQARRWASPASTQPGATATPLRSRSRVGRVGKTRPVGKTHPASRAAKREAIRAHLRRERARGRAGWGLALAGYSRPAALETSKKNSHNGPRCPLATSPRAQTLPRAPISAGPLAGPPGCRTKVCCSLHQFQLPVSTVTVLLSASYCKLLMSARGGGAEK